jgi:hypothetical protein
VPAGVAGQFCVSVGERKSDPLLVIPMSRRTGLLAPPVVDISTRYCSQREQPTEHPHGATGVQADQLASGLEVRPIRTLTRMVAPAGTSAR